MEEMVTQLFNLVLSGGTNSITAILMLVIIGFILDRRRQLAEMEKKDAKVDKIIADYYEGNTTLTEALNDLRMVLVEIKGRLH